MSEPTTATVQRPFMFDLKQTLNSERFDSSWREVASVRPAPVSSVSHFMQMHYLRRRPAVVSLCLVMVVGLEPVGTSVFSIPPHETETRYGCIVWELARLYLLDEIPRNAETWLIAQSVKYIRKHHADVSLLVSYADPAVGHRGTIYRAGNWIEDGMTDEERKTPRFDYLNPHTNQRYGRRGNVPEGIEPTRIRRVQKYRFLYWLKAQGSAS